MASDSLSSIIQFSRSPKIVIYTLDTEFLPVLTLMPLLWQLQWGFPLITGSFDISLGSLGHPEAWVMAEVPIYFICSRERLQHSTLTSEFII